MICDALNVGQPALHRLFGSKAGVFTSDPVRRGCLAIETAYGSTDHTAQTAAKTLVEQTLDKLAHQFEALSAKDPEARSGRSTRSLKEAVSVLTS
ncbi:hypothetical protein [Roseobacter weihaiensis]|uniref:hypothetical protein n=1 Tax=Roseobacter weihaiensis TaxID=2763262 RepID=UPI00387344CC